MKSKISICFLTIVVILLALVMIEKINTQRVADKAAIIAQSNENVKEEKNEKGILYFKGKENPKVDTLELRKLIREEYDVPPGKPFSLEFKIDGMYFIEKNTIQGFKANLIIDSPKVMKKIITFELMELKNE